MPRTAATPVQLCVAEVKGGKQCRQPVEDHYTEKGEVRKHGPLAHEPRVHQTLMGRKRMRKIIARQQGRGNGSSTRGASHGATGTPQWLKDERSIPKPAYIKKDRNYVIEPVTVGQRISAFLRQRGIDPNKSEAKSLTPKQRRRVMSKGRKVLDNDDNR